MGRLATFYAHFTVWLDIILFVIGVGNLFLWVINHFRRQQVEANFRGVVVKALALTSEDRGSNTGTGFSNYCLFGFGPVLYFSLIICAF